MNENINYYKQMAAFNKGYEDGEKRPSIGAAFFVLFLATVVICGIVVFIK